MPSNNTRPSRFASRTLFLLAASVPAIQASSAAAHAPGTTGAQDRIEGGLTLEQAVEIAMGNNPTYRQSINDQRVADWDVRSTYAALVPTISANSSVSWQGGGEQQFGSLTLGDLGFSNQPSYYFSSYGISLGLGFSFGALKAPAQAKANRRATIAATQSARASLVTQVSSAYIDALRQSEGLGLAQLQLTEAQLNLELAQGQFEVGAVTSIDVGSAEIQVGRAEVGVLQARNAVETSRRRLLQQLGVSGDTDFELTTAFELTEPTWEAPELYRWALADNPGLAANLASKEASDLSVGISRTAYLPSFRISTGWSGFTRQASSTDNQVAQAMAGVAAQQVQCETINDLYSRLAQPLPPQNCSIYQFTDADRTAIEEANSQFPFDFQGSPPSVSLSMSIPIFQGLGRERNLEAAKVASEDLAYRVRENEISLETDVSIALGNVRTAYQSAVLEERNRELAERQLALSRERYQLGVITFVELTNAQTLFAQAERDRVIALFAYHDSVSALEALVGRTLR